ncbi:MAG: 16S rRNA (guanine(527)-N(7))-methyltransferase RsmG [Sphingomicrobium sp.]
MIDRLSEIVGATVPRETFEKLTAYVALLTESAQTQNLVSPTTLATIWERHIIDSAQLLRIGGVDGSWVDIGSGAGLPGLVLAIASPDPVTLVEPRRLRAEFLQSVIDRLALPNASVVQGKASVVSAKFDKVTARAVAPTSDLFGLCHHLSHRDTVWVLPKGRTAQKELDEARATWQGEFRLEPSRTDAQASILVATGVRRRRAR